LTFAKVLPNLSLVNVYPKYDFNQGFAKHEFNQYLAKFWVLPNLSLDNV
jgi:hypothetical protein